MPTPSTVAIIGCGRWGQTVARKLDAMPTFRVSRVFDPAVGATVSLLRELEHAQSAHSIQEACDGVDCVVLATPPHTDRLLQLAMVLDAGVKRIRVEKPLAMNWQDAEDMRLMAESASASITVGHTSVWNSLVPALARHIGVLHKAGRLQQLDFYRCCERGPAHPAPPIWDLASHDVALHYAVCPWIWEAGPPSVVDAGEDKHGSVWFQTDDGSTFTVSHTHPFTTRVMTINREHAYNETVQVLQIDGTRIQGGMLDPLGAELAGWAKGYIMPAKIGVDVVAVCEQAQALLAEKRIERVVG